MAKRRRSSGAAKAAAPSPQAKAPIQKSPKGKSPKRNVKKAKKRPSKGSAPVDDSSLSTEVLRLVATKLAGTPNLMKLARVNKACKIIVDNEIASGEAKAFDVAEIANGSNPLICRFYDVMERKDGAKFLEEVRRVVNLIQNMVNALPGNDNVIKNFNVHGLGWEFVSSISEFRRCPHLLQKKIVKLIKNHFTGTVEFEYVKAFVRPSRFFSMFKHRLETITKLDLGDMKALRAISLRSTVFPHLVNLKEFTWHKAELWLVNALPYPHKLESLCLTLTENHVDAEALSVLLNCQGLKALYTGFCIPANPTRFDWDVLLRSYQAFWNQRQYVPDDMLTDKGFEPVPIAEDKDADYPYKAFPKLRKAGFWNAPEYLFVIMGKMGIHYDEIQLGILTQDQLRLCSLDSVMQALFKYNQPKYNINKLSVDQLKLYTHSMPVISLDYYLPNLMVALGQALPSLKTLDLFVHCLAASSGMPSSWLLENSRPKRPRALFEDLTHFSFHMDGFCLLDDLDTYLPPSIQSVTLSFIAPRENRRRFLASLVKFIEYLGDINRFPDLDELHIQVWGVACFELLLNTVVDRLHGLRRLSLICRPVNKQLSSVADLIGDSINKCNKLAEFNISSDLANELMSDEKSDLNHWRSALFSLGVRCGITSNCELSVKSFPHCEGWNRFIVKPIEPPEEKVDENGENGETSSSDDLSYDDEDSTEKSDDRDEEDDELDSFVVENEDDVEFEESEDELDKAERELEGESNKREKRWQKNRARIFSDCSENPESDYHEDEVVVFRHGDQPEEELDEDEEENQNSFLYDMAEEKNGSTSEEGETEPEGEDLEGSDDEDLFAAQAEMVNARARRPPPAKRRRIIDSDSE